MLTWIGRIIGVLGLIVLINDIMAWQGGGGMRFSDIGEWWFWAHPDSLQLAQPALERHVAPWLWDPVMLTVLLWPLAIVLLVIAGILIGLGRWRGMRRR